MSNKSLSLTKKILIGIWLVLTLVMFTMAITSEVSVIEKYMLISAVIIIFLGPLAIARINYRRAGEDEDSDAVTRE